MTLGIGRLHSDFEKIVLDIELCLEDRRYKGLNKKIDRTYSLLEDNLTGREMEKVEWAFTKLSNSYEANLKNTKEKDLSSFCKDFYVYWGVVNKLFEELEDIGDRVEVYDEFN